MPIIGGRANPKRNEDNSRSDNRRDFTFVRYLETGDPPVFSVSRLRNRGDIAFMVSPRPAASGHNLSVSLLWSPPLRPDCSGDMVLASALSIVIQNICPKGVRVRFYCMAGETARHQQFSSDEIACFQQLV